MGTRGYIGIRNNQGILEGYYNHFDSYYDNLGREVINLYFDGDGKEIKEVDDLQEDIGFLQDGLFCEYGYVYNIENDTIEIYRGCFNTKQEFNIPLSDKVLKALDFENEKKEYFTHLIMIVDKKKHTKEQVLEAFDKHTERDSLRRTKLIYPEHKIIPLKLPKNYIPIV